MRRLLILLPLIVGCGKEPVKQVVQDAEFAPYVASFEQAAASQGVTAPVSEIEMVFTEETLQAPDAKTGSILAICEHKEVERIKVNRAKWEKLDEDRKEALVAHEIGHCGLHRSHDDSEEDGQPVSLMHSKLIGSEQYKKHRDEYMKELFRR